MVNFLSASICGIPAIPFSVVITVRVTLVQQDLQLHRPLSRLSRLPSLIVQTSKMILVLQLLSFCCVTAISWYVTALISVRNSCRRGS